MPIREATEADIPRIVEMGSRSLREGTYRDEIDNPEQSAKLALEVIKAGNGKLLVADENGKLAGLIAFLIYPHYFTGKLTAIEIMWYVEPEFRRSMIGVVLARAMQRTAKEMGATKSQITAPTAEVGHALTLMGYKQLEVGYQKSL